MSKKTKSVLKDRAEFVQHHLRGKRGGSVFAPFTGQDYSAWHAFVYLIELYGRGDANGREQAVIAMKAVLMACQRSVLDVFKKAIPGGLDWSDEPNLWRMVAPRYNAEHVGYGIDRVSIAYPCPDGERKCNDPAHAMPDPKRPDQSKPCPDCGAVYILRKAMP